VAKHSPESNIRQRENHRYERSTVALRLQPQAANSVKILWVRLYKMKNKIRHRNMPVERKQFESPVMTTEEVVAYTKLSRSSIFAWSASGKFPQPIKYSPRKIVWLKSAVDSWLTNLSKNPYRGCEFPNGQCVHSGFPGRGRSGPPQCGSAMA
jgi:predicted DNA-binding transcriptional regulator AlpA